MFMNATHLPQILSLHESRNKVHSHTGCNFQDAHKGLNYYILEQFTTFEQYATFELYMYTGSTVHNVHLEYTTSEYTTLEYTTSEYTTLEYTTSEYTTLEYTTSEYNTLEHMSTTSE